MKTLVADSKDMCARAGILEIHHAAQILDRHLGKGLAHWISELKKDYLESRRESPDGYTNDIFTWGETNQGPYIEESSLYYFIAQEEPKSLGIGTIDGPDGNFSQSALFESYSVNVNVDFEHGGRLLVWFCSPRKERPSGVLTSEEAIALAQQLLDAAYYCERHQYNFMIGKTEPKDHGDAADLTGPDVAESPADASKGEVEVEAAQSAANKEHSAAGVH